MQTLAAGTLSVKAELQVAGRHADRTSSHCFDFESSLWVSSGISWREARLAFSELWDIYSF